MAEQHTAEAEIRAEIQQIRDEQYRCEREGHWEDARAWRDEASMLEMYLDDLSE